MIEKIKKELIRYKAKWACYVGNHFDVTYVSDYDHKRYRKLSWYRILDAVLCLITFGEVEGKYAFKYIFDHPDWKRD